MLASLTDWARDSVATAGYSGLAALILVENLVPPIPSELILPLAGFYVGTGEFSYPLAVLAATIGSLLGALVIYGIARRGGRPLLLRYGRVLRVGGDDIDRADLWFERWGAWLVFGGRMVPGLRSLVSIPAGLSEMPLGRFALLTTAGSAVWNAVLIGAGWALGANYETVGTVIGPVGTVVIAVAALALIGGAVWWLRRARAAGSTAPPDPEP